MVREILGGYWLLLHCLLLISLNNLHTVFNSREKAGEKKCFFFGPITNWSTLPKPLNPLLIYSYDSFSQTMTCWFCFLASFLQDRFSLSLALLGFLLPSCTALFNSTHHVEEREMHWGDWELTQSRQDWTHFKCLLFSTLQKWKQNAFSWNTISQLDPVVKSCWWLLVECSVNYQSLSIYPAGKGV